MRVRFLLLVVMLGALWGGHAATPLPALACSCMPPQTMDAYRGDSTAMVFAGQVATVAPSGVEVQVETWFQGPGDHRITFAADGFGDQSAACQDRWPTVGSRWIWVAWVPEPGAQPHTNICQPKALLDTPEGAEMLASARDAFEGGVTVEPPPPEPPPAVSGPPLGGVGPAVVFAGVGLAVVTLFAGVAVLARRGRRSDLN
jgi:hypothetical protein